MSPRRARRLPESVPRKERGGAAGSGAARPGGPGQREPGQREPGQRDLPRRGQDLPAGPERTETWPDGDWVVRTVPGAAVVKSYRCPGCDQEIPPGVPHLVAWPALTPGLDQRRHWHRACWQRRLSRRPGVRRRR